MMKFKSKDFKKGDFKSVENRILKYVKRHQPVYMGEIVKDLKMSESRGRKRIMGMMNEGLLRYSKRSAKIVK